MSTSISIGNALQGLLAAGSFWTFLGGVIGAAITYVILTYDPAGGRNVRNIAAACCARRAGATGAGDSIPPSPTRALPDGTLRAVAPGDGGTGLGGERGGAWSASPRPRAPHPPRVSFVQRVSRGRSRARVRRACPPRRARHARRTTSSRSYLRLFASIRAIEISLVHHKCNRRNQGH